MPFSDAITGCSPAKGGRQATGSDIRAAPYLAPVRTGEGRHGSAYVREERILFPRILEIERAAQSASMHWIPDRHYITAPIHGWKPSTTKRGRRSPRSINFLRLTRSPDDACTTYRLVFEELKAFEQDLHQHVHLENNLFVSQSGCVAANDRNNQPELNFWAVEGTSLVVALRRFTRYSVWVHCASSREPSITDSETVLAGKKYFNNTIASPVIRCTVLAAISGPDLTRLMSTLRQGEAVGPMPSFGPAMNGCRRTT